jgi:hypothetical protein
MRCPLLGAKRTSRRIIAMSAFDPFRTSALLPFRTALSSHDVRGCDPGERRLVRRVTHRLRYRAKLGCASIFNHDNTAAAEAAGVPR